VPRSVLVFAIKASREHLCLRSSTQVDFHFDQKYKTWVEVTCTLAYRSMKLITAEIRPGACDIKNLRL